MDYNKINKTQIDGNGNIVLQDVNGENITINYNDAEKLKEIFEHISETQSFELKELIGKQHKEVLTEIRKIQDKIDEQNTEQKAKNALFGLDDFLKELAEMKMDGIKSRLKMNYKLLREYQEMLILEDDPKRKMKYQKEIENINSTILEGQNELQTILKK